MNVVWNDAEVEFIIENSGKLTDQKLAETMSVLYGRHITLPALRQKRQSLGLKKKFGRGICELDTFQYPIPNLSLCLHS